MRAGPADIHRARARHACACACEHACAVAAWRAAAVVNEYLHINVNVCVAYVHQQPLWRAATAVAVAVCIRKPVWFEYNLMCSIYHVLYTRCGVHMVYKYTRTTLGLGREVYKTCAREHSVNLCCGDRPRALWHRQRHQCWWRQRRQCTGFCHRRIEM